MRIRRSVGSPRAGESFCGIVTAQAANLHLGAKTMTVNGPKLNAEPVRAIVWSDYI